MDSEPSPTGGNDSDGARGQTSAGMPRWAIAAMAAAVLALLFGSQFFPAEERQEVNYDTYLEFLEAGVVTKSTFDNETGAVSGELVPVAELTDSQIELLVTTNESREEKEQLAGGEKFKLTAPLKPTDADLDTMIAAGVEFKTPTTSFWAAYLPLLLILGAMIAVIIWAQRRAQGQMSGVMSIGRSKAKMYSTERPGTTFDDVAGYEGVKQEISEIVDFLKHPEKFAEIGARTPKGVLLVGPPGTGKTLIARAVAGEAGVPFLSVTGSDFMEMFVGVGASRVRDLFNSARKMGRAIIFVDEIDSIGRKRGAGLGGGHDEREQTLNQMLSEMDGFEPSEGIVMMAATNRPDILDPALLRPGRFDRQVVVPLPESDERKAILGVHCQHKRIGADVDLHVLARGTPGMSGADLANLVNEAALFAVRQGATEIAMHHFDQARDRVMVGQTREAVVMSDEEKEVTAYHEGGHAVMAAMLPHADPVHKVTILPTGMTLGATHFLPEERRHIDLNFALDRLAVSLGGRTAEELVYNVTSSGASNDLQTATELTQRMVREWGMSERIGPMAWGAASQVFLGDGLMNTRDYSEHTARVIDEEIEAILRTQEQRCHQVLAENRKGLDLIARALIEHETISGLEVNRLLAIARGDDPEPVRPPTAPADPRELANLPSSTPPLPPPPPPPPPANTTSPAPPPPTSADQLPVSESGRE